ncbi:MAG TPA: serine/threonine-protein kinase, partial [Gemmatimonadales bacterium]|nr:serine/threonine-protein kinase [Gemmatimonadales bacterium]
MPSLLEVVRSALSDRYRVERELGHGGMATVYLAEDLRHDRPVAIKVLDPALAAGVGGERFLREIRFAARLTHPNILPLFESGEIPARPDEPGFATLYYVMPYVQGESLRARLDREGPLPLRDTVRITASIASALEHAHAQGIVHRDVKPENILLEAGEAVLADLGIARAIGAATGDRLTATRLTLGTPAYMSPEQVTADAHVDGRSDQYSLACVTYEMLTGEPPFGRGKAQAAMTRRVVEPPPRVGIIRDRCPPQVDDVLARAMARAAADRFPTPGEFARALGEAAGSGTGYVRAALAGGSRRKRAGVAIVLIVATAGAVGLVLSRSEGGSITGPASVMAVMPLVPASDDSALARLGRDLVVTVSQTLDGIGGVRAVDAQTVLLRAGSEPPGGLAGAMRMARDLGAGAALHGSLVRIGRSVRSDVMLSAADTGAPLARVSVTALPDSIGAITDSIVRGLLRQIWKGRDAPSPSLDVAMRTRSFDALREFLAGEQMLVRGAWIEAAEAYTRAIEADSTFWLAYWRAAYARGWHGEPLDPALAAALEAHADEVPPRERLMLRATALTEDSVSGGISLLRELTHRYPDHWFGWLMYGDVLTHFGAAVGESRQEAVAALDRAVTLNPNLIPAWEHLAWLTLLERDTAAAARAIEILRRSGNVTSESFGWDEGVSLALTDRLIRGDSMGAARLMEAHVADLAGRADPSFGATALVRHAFPVEQIEVVRRVLARGPPPAAIPAYR